MPSLDRSSKDHDPEDHAEGIARDDQDDREGAGIAGRIAALLLEDLVMGDDAREVEGKADGDEREEHPRPGLRRVVEEARRGHPGEDQRAEEYREGEDIDPDQHRGPPANGFGSIIETPHFLRDRDSPRRSARAASPGTPSRRP